MRHIFRQDAQRGVVNVVLAAVVLICQSGITLCRLETCGFYRQSYFQIVIILWKAACDIKLILCAAGEILGCPECLKHRKLCTQNGKTIVFSCFFSYFLELSLSCPFRWKS